MLLKGNLNLSSRETPLTQLVSKTGCTIEDLLAEDSFLEESKSLPAHNPKLTAFLTSKRNFIKLMDYIITMPSEEDTHERKHKYPFMINELFSQDGIYLLNPFFEEEPEEEEPESYPEKSEPEECEDDQTEATADSGEEKPSEVDWDNWQKGASDIAKELKEEEKEEKANEESQEIDSKEEDQKVETPEENKSEEEVTEERAPENKD